MPHQVLRHGWNNPILLQTMIRGVSQGVKNGVCLLAN